MKDNLIIYVSSRNNYDMLEGEVLKNIDLEGFEFINIDDKSCEEEIIKGKEICKRYGIKFLENKSRGVQMATQTLIDWINENRPKCKWIICFQHDNWPLTKDFFTKISKLIKENKLSEFGTIGFNVLDNGDFTGSSYKQFLKGDTPLGMLGLAHLSVKDNWARCLSTNRSTFLDDRFKKPFAIEIPFWAIMGINVELYKKYIIPTTDYQFHLWGSDLVMQFNYNNIISVILPDLYCFNDQFIKEKYGMNYNSATGAREGDEYHFGEYGPHLTNWKKRWGWDYEKVITFEYVQENYKNTLIYDYFNHDITKGPLKSYDL